MNLPEPTVNALGDKSEPQLRDLFLFTAGGRTFAVASAEVDGTAEAKKPTPLPQAPASILGVVYARGGGSGRGNFRRTVDLAAADSGNNFAPRR